jgi:hypothetical protein
MSSSGDEYSSSVSDDAVDEFPHSAGVEKPVKRAKDFGRAFTKILDRTLDDQAPSVLPARPSRIQKIEQDNQERRVQSELTRLRRELLLQGFAEPDTANEEFEAALRKVATRGVTTLFNALVQQRKSLREVADDLTTVHRRHNHLSKTSKQFQEVLAAASGNTTASDAAAERSASWLKSSAEDQSALFDEADEMSISGSEASDSDF